MKIIRFLKENSLFLATLFLLAFIPLYPKIPLVDVQNTWVYVRVEDVLVSLVIVLWLYYFFRRKITLKTPLTIPILMYWIIGGIATLHGVLIIFPTISNVFSNVAFLSLLRRIEYMSLFFVAYSGMKDKKFVPWVSLVLASVMVGIVGYGFGQKYLGFPAYLTMNEEFAKGIPIHLSQLSRVPSTFGGQYDLAAYLVLVVPILVSLAFGFKNLILKAFLLLSSALGFALLFMTVSRVSVFVLLISLITLLIIRKKKIVIFSLAVLTVLLLVSFPSLAQRFSSTVSEVDVLLDAKSGTAIGQVKKVPAEYFKDKVVIRQAIGEKDTGVASSAAILPFSMIPKEAALIVIPSDSNGESLPQGTSYINLPLSPVKEIVKEYFYEKPNQSATVAARVNVLDGEYLIKRAKAYDLSFTTRFQGEWPRTILAFDRNILLGSGYGSVSLAVDNDFLRILGESGILGFLSFSCIFLIIMIYARKILPFVDNPVAKSFVLGFIAGTVGLILNAVLIDVFEASKVAFTYWMLTGVTVGMLTLYKVKPLDLTDELKRALFSSYAMVVYFFFSAYILFSQVTDNFFVGDDFTWFRWAADCSSKCDFLSTVGRYFTQSGGFFYRPGTKVYFDIMYSLFWLNQTVYHFVSLFLHFIVLLLVFLLAKKIFKNSFSAASATFLFLILSGPTEMVVWTAATGHLFNAILILLSLLLFVIWKEQKKSLYLFLSVGSVFLSLLFHELGVVAPILIMAYDWLFIEKSFQKTISQKLTYSALVFPLLPYGLLRALSHSHWFNGDYSYNLVKLPFNIVGNSLGYFLLALLGPSSLSLSGKLRDVARSHVGVALVGVVLVILIGGIAYKQLSQRLAEGDRRIVVFACLFFLIALLPFIGLGNVTARYSYLSSFGFVLLLVLFFRGAYRYLLSNGKGVATSVLVLTLIIFSSLHLFQMQKTQKDWTDAGLKSQNFLSSLNYVYAKYPKSETENLYFVNVPIRSGDAWLFPVGISDAVWLVFRDENMQIYQMPSAEDAFLAKGTNPGRVLQFNGNGSVTELTKIKTGEIVPVK